MNSRSVLGSLALLGVVATAGCATNEAGAPSSEAQAPRQYRTGSNIPVKDDAPPATAEEREKAAEAIRALQRTGSSGKPKS